MLARFGNTGGGCVSWRHHMEFTFLSWFVLHTFVG